MPPDDRHVVMHSDGQLACKGWRGAPGSGFIWSRARPDSDWVWIFPTLNGAQLFANMNGGTPVALAQLAKVAA